MRRIVIILMYFRTDSGKLSSVLFSSLDLSMVSEVTCMSVEAYFSAGFSSFLFSFSYVKNIQTISSTQQFQDTLLAEVV